MTDARGTKITKVQASYRQAEGARVRCGTCTMFRPPRGCSLVTGDISASAVCAFWDPKNEPEETPAHA